METGSALTTLLVFLIGAATGALFVTLERQCRLERLKDEFRRQLESAVVMTRAQSVVKPAVAHEQASRRVERTVPMQPPPPEPIFPETADDVAAAPDLNPIRNQDAITHASL